MPAMVVLPERLSLSSSASLGSIRLMENPVSSMSQTELDPFACARTKKCPRFNSNGRRTVFVASVAVLASAALVVPTNQSGTREYAKKKIWNQEIREIHEKRQSSFLSC